MRFTVFVVDESLLPGESAQGSPAATPAAIFEAIRKNGGRWASVSAKVDQFADAFQSLDRFIGGKGFFPQLAFYGSPHMLLAGDPSEPILGYFEASLVPHLHGVFSQLATDVEKVVASKDEATEAVQRAVLSALEEAAERGYAVAILHNE